MNNINYMKLSPTEKYEIGQDKQTYFPEWSVKDDSTLFNKVYKLAHSTFDISNFTEVGSPTISNDGIYSDIGIYDFVTAGKPDLWNYSSWSIVSPYFTPSELPSSSSYIVNYMSTINGGDDGINLSLSASGDFQVYCPSSTAGATIFTTYVMGATVGNTYQFRCDFTGTQFKFYYRQKGNDWTLAGSEERTVNIGIQINDLTFGGRNGGSNVNVSYILAGSMDLKYYSVKGDNIPIFSGSKTGSDTIKADDYTVVGSPTVSSDNIASDFTNSDYLTKNLGITPTSSFEISTSFTTPVSLSTNQFIFSLVEDTTVPTPVYSEYMDIGIVNGKLRCRIVTNSNVNYSYTISANTTYYAKLIYQNGTAYSKLSTDGVNWNEYTLGTVNIISLLSKLYLGNNSNSNNAWLGTIDLNSFKIYVDGKLVYIPCLKIPYNKAANGQKVVDVAYRARVEDEFKNYGYTEYFTLDETNNTFTLPSHKANDIVESYVSGTGGYELYANNKLKQWGDVSVVNETVNLYKSYGNTNYRAIALTHILDSGTYTETSVELKYMWNYIITNLQSDSFDLMCYDSGLEPTHVAAWRTEGYLIR